jgi:hypothetical protein
METLSGPPEHKKSASMFHVPDLTCRSHRMQKHKSAVMCPDALFAEYVPVPTENENENSASTFHYPDAPECTT